MTQAPGISVVIPTRNRGDLVCATIRSILSGPLQPDEIIIVDQSDSGDTQSAAAQFAVCPGFQYVRSATRGISAARNEGVRLSRCALIAHTDDDCEALPDWLPGIVEAFTVEPSAAIAFGNVVAGAHSARGFIPAYRVDTPILIRGVAQKHRTEGIGACFAYRAALWRELRGFDELLGGGTAFSSAEEVDFVIRALAKGYAVLETPAFGVTHHGFRTWGDADRLMEGYLYGIGAACAKHARIQGIAFGNVLLHLAARWAFGAPVVDFEHTPNKLPRLRGFLRGVRDGFKHSIDSDGHFIPLLSARPSTPPIPASAPNRNGRDL